MVPALGSTHIAIELIQETSRLLSMYSSLSLSQVPQMLQQNKSITVGIVLFLRESLLGCISEITITYVMLLMLMLNCVNRHCSCSPSYM
jgi:hypothetical protein